jgi:peptide/nickel transport system permease protein
VGPLIIRRLGAALVLIVIVSVVVFGLLELVPGDAAEAIAGESGTPEQIAAIREELGLDRPVWERFGSWFGAAASGDLGESLFNNYSVSEAIKLALPVTAALIGGALIFAVIIGLPLGVVAGWKSGSAVDRAVSVVSSVGMAVPVYFVGVLLALFALKSTLLPATGFVRLTDDPVLWAKHLLLPVIALGLSAVAEIARQGRAEVIRVSQLDFVRTNRANGLSEAAVLFRHVLKNSMIPIVTVIGLQVSRLFSLSVLVEQVFALPGLGSLLVQAVFRRDIPMVQGVTLLVTVVVILTSLVVDIAYSYLNPRTRVA